MANNRLYIVDRSNGEKFMLCKSYGYGWSIFWQLWLGRAMRVPVLRTIINMAACAKTITRLNLWLKDRDIEASQCGGKDSDLELKTEYEID